MRRECRDSFPRHQLQGKALVSDSGIHHGTCVTKTFLAFPVHAQPAILRIWQESYGHTATGDDVTGEEIDSNGIGLGIHIILVSALGINFRTNMIKCDWKCVKRSYECVKTGNIISSIITWLLCFLPGFDNFIPGFDRFVPGFDRFITASIQFTGPPPPTPQQ